MSTKHSDLLLNFEQTLITHHINVKINATPCDFRFEGQRPDRKWTRRHDSTTAAAVAEKRFVVDTLVVEVDLRVLKVSCISRCPGHGRTQTTFLGHCVAPRVAGWGVDRNRPTSYLRPTGADKDLLRNRANRLSSRPTRVTPDRRSQGLRS